MIKLRDICCYGIRFNFRGNCFEDLYNLVGYIGCNLFMNLEKYKICESFSWVMFLLFGKIFLIEM